MNRRTGKCGIFMHRGNLIGSLADWLALIPARHNCPGRSAPLLARTWFPACGFPPSFVAALAMEPRFGGLTAREAHIEYSASTPGAGGASATDLMVLARGGEVKQVAIAVEAKVDEGFSSVVRRWLSQGSSQNSAANRRVRLDEMCNTLGLDPLRVSTLRYQLLHRTYSAWHFAQQQGTSTAVMAVHSFPPAGSRGAANGWNDFRSFADALMPGAPGPVVGQPWLAGVRGSVQLWLMWVEDVGGMRRK